MKLSSKPKPVRIRISLGGIEHSTLESLKENITPEILDFTDGRLQRWLERQNEVVVLDKIKNINRSIDKGDNANLLELYKVLLNNADKKNLLDFIYEWGNDDKRSKELAKYILKTNLDAFPGLFDYHFRLFQSTEWEEILLPHDDSESEFKLAKECYKIDELIVAERLLLRIKERGDCSEADKFYTEKYVQNRRLFAMNPEEELQEIADDWSKYKKLKIVPNSEYFNKEKQIFEFIKACNEVFPPEQEIGASFNRKNEYPKKFPINEFVERDFLDDEKRAVRAMLGFYCNRKYETNVAKETFRKEKNKITDKFKLKHEVLCVNNLEVIKEVVKKIIKNILFKKIQ